MNAIAAHTIPSHAIAQSKRKLVRLCVGLAVLFLILGSGNILFGRYKRNEYLQVLSEAKHELASPKARAKIPLLTQPLNSDRQSLGVNRVLLRLDFYSFVMLGGQCFLAISGICILISLLAARKAE